MEEAVCQVLVLMPCEHEAAVGLASWLVLIPAALGLPKGSFVSCIEGRGKLPSLAVLYWQGQNGSLTCVQGIKCQAS